MNSTGSVPPAHCGAAAALPHHSVGFVFLMCLVLSLHLVAWSLETELTHMRHGLGVRV